MLPPERADCPRRHELELVVNRRIICPGVEVNIVLWQTEFQNSQGVGLATHHHHHHHRERRLPSSRFRYPPGAERTCELAPKEIGRHRYSSTWTKLGRKYKVGIRVFGNLKRPREARYWVKGWKSVQVVSNGHPRTRIDHVTHRRLTATAPGPGIANLCSSSSGRRNRSSKCKAS